MTDRITPGKFQGVVQDERGFGLVLFPEDEQNHAQTIYLTLEDQELIVGALMKRWSFGTLKAQRMILGQAVLPSNRAK